MKPTFRQQYDKIVGAYLRNELRPSRCEACFVGNLLNGVDRWASGRDVQTGKLEPHNKFFTGALMCVEKESSGLYTLQEVADLEQVFLKVLMNGRPGYHGEIVDGKKYRDGYEDRLFKAMEVTLEALKALHEAKGEVVEDYVFSKRVLV